MGVGYQLRLERIPIQGRDSAPRGARGALAFPLFLFLLVFPLLYDIPVVYSSDRNLHSLAVTAVSKIPAATEGRVALP